MSVLSTMMPRNLLNGGANSDASKLNDSSDNSGTLASLYAARGGSLGNTSGAAGALSSSSSANNAMLLNSIIADEQRRQQQALFLAAASQPGGASDRLARALLLQQNADQQALAGLLPAVSLPTASGMNGLGGLGLLGLRNPLLAARAGLLPGTGSAAAAAAAASFGAKSDTQGQQAEKTTGRKGRTGTFPQKLHQMLSDLEKEEGGTGIACFLPHGRAFAIHKPKEFVNSVMPKYFRMSRFSSFQRQLNLYDFQRITEGPDKGAYFHELFVKGRPQLSTRIKRNKIKGVSGGPTNPVSALAGRPWLEAQAAQLGTTHPGFLGSSIQGFGVSGLALNAQQQAAASAPASLLLSSLVLGGAGAGTNPNAKTKPNSKNNQSTV